MKAFKIALLLIICSLSLSAQISKGRFMVETGINLGDSQSIPFIGTTGISFRLTDDYVKDYTNGTSHIGLARRFSNFSLAPSIGYVFMKNLLIGGDFQYYKNNYRLKDYDHSTIKYRSVMYGMFIRKYFGAGRLLPLVEGGVGLGLSKNVSDETSPGGALYQESERRDIFYYSGAAGFSYMFGPRVRINLLAKVQQTEERPINTENFHFANTRIVNFDSGAVLSFSYYLFKQ